MPSDEAKQARSISARPSSLAPNLCSPLKNSKKLGKTHLCRKRACPKTETDDGIVMHLEQACSSLGSVQFEHRAMQPMAWRSPKTSSEPMSRSLLCMRPPRLSPGRDARATSLLNRRCGTRLHPSRTDATARVPAQPLRRGSATAAAGRSPGGGAGPKPPRPRPAGPGRSEAWPRPTRAARRLSLIHI